jgi:hypothetical protein
LRENTDHYISGSSSVHLRLIPIEAEVPIQLLFVDLGGLGLVLVISVIPCNGRFILLGCESHTSLGVERRGTLRFLNLTNQVLRLIHKLGVALLVVSEVSSSQHWRKNFGLIFDPLALELSQARLLAV